MFPHVTTILLDKPATQEQVDELLAGYYQTRMDMDRPLWYLTFVPALETGGSLLIAAIDHTVGDGAALVETLLSLADEKEEISSSSGG